MLGEFFCNRSGDFWPDNIREFHSQSSDVDRCLILSLLEHFEQLIIIFIFHFVFQIIFAIVMIFDE